MAALAAAIAPTGMNAHYRIEHVRARDYWLATEMQLGDEHDVLVRPVTVRHGDHLRLDLDNSTLAHNGDLGSCEAAARTTAGAASATGSGAPNYREDL